MFAFHIVHLVCACVSIMNEHANEYLFCATHQDLRKIIEQSRPQSLLPLSLSRATAASRTPCVSRGGVRPAVSSARAPILEADTAIYAYYLFTCVFGQLSKPLLVATVYVDSCKIHFLYSKKCKIHLQSGTICSLVRFAKRTTGVVPFQRKLLLTTDTRRVKGEYRSKGGWSPAWHPLPCATVVECQQPVRYSSSRHVLQTSRHWLLTRAADNKTTFISNLILSH